MKGTITLDESDSEYFYLCGVVYPWSWADNFHCVFKKAEGKEFSYKFRDTEVHVINAEKIEISEKWIDWKIHLHRIDFIKLVEIGNLRIGLQKMQKQKEIILIA